MKFDFELFVSKDPDTTETDNVEDGILQDIYTGVRIGKFYL